MNEAGPGRRRSGITRPLALPFAVLGPVAAAGVLLLTFVQLLGVPRSPHVRPDSRQLQYQRAVEAERAALVPARLSYPGDVAVDVGDPVTLTVNLTPGSPEPGTASREAPAAAGALVAARLAGDGSVRIEPQSPERQPVVAPGDHGVWKFAVSAEKPGRRDLTLTVVVYRGASDEPLATSGPFTVPVHVRATFGYRLEQAGGAVTGLLAFVGVSGGVAFTWLLRRVRRKRRTTPRTTSRTKPPATATEPEPPEEPPVV